MGGSGEEFNLENLIVEVSTGGLKFVRRTDSGVHASADNPLWTIVMDHGGRHS